MPPLAERESAPESLEGLSLGRKARLIGRDQVQKSSKMRDSSKKAPPTEEPWTLPWSHPESGGRARLLASLELSLKVRWLVALRRERQRESQPLTMARAFLLSPQSSCQKGNLG